MQKDSASLWHADALNGLALYRATIVRHHFKRHQHDTYVIGMVDHGVQRFACQRDRYITPPRGLIVINPGEAHTGEAAASTGFHYRALYPEVSDVQAVANEIRQSERWSSITDLPYFATRVIHDSALFSGWNALHHDLETGDLPRLEQQSRYRMLLAALIRRYASLTTASTPRQRENASVRRVRDYLHAHYAEDVSLDTLAKLVNWTPYTLIRVFRVTTGLPPHAYLEGVRVRQAQMLIQQCHPLSDVAYRTGFSSQSHFTTTFRRVLGVTPGAYAQTMK